ncbi:lysine-sensitive aspartokinase 3 [Francisella hispaniensis]|uniref:Aspartokinase n=1 Tax=Francisella hispaniensis FSC454 TaxID=1088883 RepID=A0AAC9NPU6_9GAMM|nr:lysine-sensitive aspartokinase 3 [Francisella hispaniensis]APD51191.1 lysine-sensitive aspartokinase 3 [Francisella hispaniensis FSC454]KYW82906.1 lysine-sensitive aspartokinase 3 [Francisella hispaniensis FSC454]
MSETIVAKFGGTSVANQESIRKCANIVNSDNRIKLVVVSAQSGITNLLIQLANNKDNSKIEKIIGQIESIVNPILQSINSESVTTSISDMIAELRMFANMAAYFSGKQLSDSILAFGEIISSFLVASVFNQSGINTYHLDSRKILKTNSDFGCASPNLSALETNAIEHILPKIDQGYVCVLGGFIGSDAHGNTTTLGRGCGDYSAALYTQAIKATQLKIYTDVTGIYQADPRVIPKASSLRTLGFGEAAELATFGAKVVHPKTFWPAISSNFDIYIGSTFQPELGGTLITQKIDYDRNIIAVAERKAQTLLTIKSFNMFGSQGFLVKVFSILADHNIAVDLVSTSEVSVAITLDKLGSHSMGDDLVTTELLKDLESIGNVNIKVENDLSLVSVVGTNLHQINGVSGELFSSLKDYNIRLFSHGASENSISMLVASKDAQKVVNNVYSSFFS